MKPHPLCTCVAARGGRWFTFLAVGTAGWVLAWGMATLAGPELPLKAQVVVKAKTYQVEVAETPTQQSIGLSGRTALAATAGMLFLYAEKQPHTFWMREMLIPIDILWLDNETVVHIVHRAPPPKAGTPLESLETYTPPQIANAVLELAAGEARGVKVGDRVSIIF